MCPSRDEPESPINQFIAPKETITSRRLEFEKKIFLLVNLILLHRPYIHDTVRSNHSRPSYDICSYAAIIITDHVYRLNYTELIHYHAKSPIIVYALVIALRVHIMDAATPNLAEKFNADKNYVYCVETIYKLPQCITNSSILNDSIQDLHEQYQNKAQDISVTQIPLTVTEENKTKAKRKEEQSPTIRQYEHGKKRKKGKPTPKKEKETMKGPSTSEMTEYNTEQQQNFIPDELQYSIDPYQQFYNQLLLQDDGPIPTDYSFDLFSNDVQEYTVGLEDDLGVSIQLVSNKRQQ